MKAHAVPQDIMNLEFKLFGNFLSLREFIFIAVGIALAWFFYFLMQNGILPGILAIPAILLFGLGGIMIGLVPVQDKSLDQWIVNYIAAIRRPTQRVWKKPGFHYTQDAGNTGAAVKNHIVAPPTAQAPSVFSVGVQQQPVQADTATIEAEQDETADITRIQQTLDQIESGRSTAPAQQPPATQQTEPQPPSAPAPANTAASATTSLPRQQGQAPQPSPTTTQGPAPIPPAATAPSATAPLATTQQSLDHEQNGNTDIEPKTLEPGQVQSVASATKQPAQDATVQQPLNKIDPTQAMAAKDASKMIRPGDIKTDPAQKPPAQPVPPQNQPHPSAAPAKSLTIDDGNIEEYATSITGLESQKNTINIVVKDANGLILPGVVCVIKNPNGDPVRAAISNVLGQVLNNVPLKDSTYTISLSKQGYVFPEIIRTLKGKEYPPIEIRSL